MEKTLWDLQAGSPRELYDRDIDDDSNASLTTRVALALRKDIISGRYRPGAKLGIVSLSKEYDCGATVTREALSRLVSEGIVNATDHKGFRVAKVSRSDLIDLTITRADIDAIGLRKSIEYGDASWEAEIIAAYHRLSSLPKHDMFRVDKARHDWDRLHNEFHVALISACRSPRLIALRNMLFAHSERYRNLSAIYAGWAGRDTKDEHKALMDSVLARNLKLATELIAAHYWQTCQSLLEAADEQAKAGVKIFI